MPQIFHRSANTLSKISLFGALVLAMASIGTLGMLNRSSYITQAGVVREQPVPFSHDHHVSGLGIDCRYCHTSVETSSFAGIPPTKTCMTCHSQVWSDSPVLAPIRDSYKTGRPIEWVRVHDLPDFVYFDHSIHIAKGVACVTCHGPVGQMELTWREAPLTMEWCLECHRSPDQRVGLRETVFEPEARPAPDPDLQRWLMETYRINRKTDCSVCHR